MIFLAPIPERPIARVRPGAVEYLVEQSGRSLRQIRLRENRSWRTPLTSVGAIWLRNAGAPVGLCGRHHEPIRLPFPSGAFNLLRKQVRRRRKVSRSDTFLLLLRQIPAKQGNPGRFHPDASVRDFNMRENICYREFSCCLCDVSSTSGASAAM
jgi:hypothetical protein